MIQILGGRQGREGSAALAKPSAPSRERIVAGAADLISRRGLNAASIRELAKHAKAPLGSTCHYFPEGKQQVATEAVRYAGGAVSRVLREELEAGPVAGLRAFLALWRGIVVDSDFRAGCPVLAVAVEEPPVDETPPALLAAWNPWAGSPGSSKRLWSARSVPPADGRGCTRRSLTGSQKGTQTFLACPFGIGQAM